MKKFTIITVCLNSEKLIAKTIESILEQTYRNFEYIIKDGLSKDNTVKIAESYIQVFSEKGISYKIISNKDKGIYDAMNQAASEATGEWILYMNSGDLFADKYVLDMINESQILNTADVVYGDRIDYRNDEYLYKKAYPLERMRDRLPFGHQSVFAKKSIYEQKSYSLNYHICSDYLFFFELYKEKKTFSYIPIAISIYDRHGISSDGKLVAQELLKIHSDMENKDVETIEMLKKEVEDYDKDKPILKRMMLKIIPDKLLEKRQAYMKKKMGWKTKEEFMKEKIKNGGRVN